MTDERLRLVERTRAHLERHRYPRAELTVLVALSGACAFLVSAWLLQAGVASMSVRYGVAGVAGYLAFVACVRLWIWWHDDVWSALDVVDPGLAVDAVRLPLKAAGSGTGDLFGGGSSAGGGASGSWTPGSDSRGAASSWLDDPGDTLGLVLLLVAAAAAGVTAIGYVVYLAPALLAEVLVDAAIVATVSHRLARMERRAWTYTLLRRTWLPAAALVLLLIISGWTLQRLAPGARSIGPALEAIRDSR